MSKRLGLRRERDKESKKLPTPAMRQDAATTGSCTTNIFSFSITVISLSLSLSAFFFKLPSLRLTLYA